MEVPVNYFAVLVAALASMVIGSLWYGPLFGKQWMALSGMNPSQLDEAKKKGMAKSYILMFIGSLVMAFVLVHSIAFAQEYLKISDLAAGIQGGLWNWLGFIAPVTLGAVLWDNKPWKLWFLNNGNNLVTLMVMGVILSLWK